MIQTRPQGFWHFCLDTLSALFQTGRIWGKPVFITIEPTNACDLGCPVCETGAKVLERPTNQMPLEHFKAIVDRIKDHTNAIQLYFMGEPLLHKRIYEMIRYAKNQGIFVNIYSNGTFMDAKACIDSGLDEINFNISGLTQASHETYRVNSNLERVKANIIALTAERERRLKSGYFNGSPPTPRINVGLIVMKHNEDQVDQFLEEVPAWGVDRAHVVDPCVRDMQQAVDMLPENRKYWFYDEAAYDKGILKPKFIPNNRCNWIYYSTVITWSGDLVPCCRDPKGKHVLGNIFQEPFEKIWNGPKYREFRRRIRTEQGKMDICKLCSSYAVPALYEFRPNPQSSQQPESAQQAVPTTQV